MCKRVLWIYLMILNPNINVSLFLIFQPFRMVNIHITVNVPHLIQMITALHAYPFEISFHRDISDSQNTSYATLDESHIQTEDSSHRQRFISQKEYDPKIQMFESYLRFYCDYKGPIMTHISAYRPAVPATVKLWPDLMSNSHSRAIRRFIRFGW